MQAPRAPEAASFRLLDMVTAAFVTVLVVSNVASSAKIVDWGVSLFGVRLAFDAGTLLFPVSYVFGDLLTEVYGYRRSRRVIWTGFACLAVSSLVLWIVRILPGEAGWEAGVGQAAYVGVLGGMSSGGIVLASLVAYIVGEFSNSVVLARLKVATRGRWLWMRTIGSTLVGEGLDTVIFVAIASAARVFPWSVFASLILTNYLFKVAVEAAMTPITYRVAAALKRVEGVDWYDEGTNFNPFALRDPRPAPSRRMHGSRPSGSRTARLSRRARG
jgi:queuosine precursor transporter